MADLLALKRLTSSDLTFFERLFRRENVGNQKSINLNRDVLVGVLYPDLVTIAGSQPDGEISLKMTILGPAAAGAFSPGWRKIVKGRGYRNWRLNGEFVHDPDGEPGRFDVMRPRDLAVFSFDGRPGPRRLTLVLLAQDAIEDKALHDNLAPLVANRSMMAITAERLREAMQATDASRSHPLSVLARDTESEQALEDVALGGSRGIRGLRRRPRPVSREELARARQAAEKLGADGEELIEAYLAERENPGGTFVHEWVSSRNAISPFDFWVRTTGGTLGDQDLKIDVKATKGPFATDFHISLAEVEEAAASAVPYLIYRVFDLTEEGALLSISGDIRGFAQALLRGHDVVLRLGISADSFTVPVTCAGLTWVDPVAVRIADEEDEEP